MASVKSLTIGGKTIFDLFYPVGSIYETESSSFNPNNSFGGTWQRIQGKMLVGVDDNDSSFNAPAKTGGEKTHTLTVSEMPSHVHQQYVASNTGTDAIRRDFDSDGNCSRYPQCDTGATGGAASQQHASVLCCIHLEKNCLRNFSSDIRKEENKL